MSGEAQRRRLRALLRLAGIRRTHELSAFETAFVHQSYAKERGDESNERMEFLGDSVLGCITASWLYERFTGEPEWIADAAQGVHRQRPAAGQYGSGGWDFPELMYSGAPECARPAASENTSVLADAFEAFVGALYLRFGLEKARQFVVAQHIEGLDHSAGALLDAKTRLQHYAQEHFSATPVYRESSRGTAQHPAFKSRVSVKGRILGRGDGPSKKAAQQAAAEAALLAISSGNGSPDPRGAIGT